LQPGSHFFGKQSSGDRSFDLEIRFNSLNLADSTLTGYLTIYGLARSGEPMQTFFDAEIIGSNHSFITREWGASAEIDLQYWQTFPEFEQLRKHFTADPALPFDFTDHDVIFMRWKERFLLPDHRITAVHGAVYDGFYYTCLNRTNRTISGIYFSPATPSSATGLLHLTQMSPAFLVGQTTVAELDSHKQQQHSTDSDIECHHDRNRPFVQQQLYPPATYTFN
ncbi:hypothetical protein GQ42DRAFT_125554, partial [Ramicandelaber brevisporus]